MPFLSVQSYSKIRFVRKTFDNGSSSHYEFDLSVVYNSATTSVALLELTCPLDSVHHILASSRKQNKLGYLQWLTEFDRLQISNDYETVEICVLGHYHSSYIQNIKRFTDFIQPSDTSESTIRHILDSAARISVTFSHKIFMAWNYCIWSVNSLDFFY